MLDVEYLFKNKKEVDVKEFSKCKVGPMTFKIKAFDIDGIGRISFMRGVALFGLMKMDTVMITPKYVDMPLLSYDRIKVLSNDTLIIEVYDTVINNVDLSSLMNIKDDYSSIPDQDLGSHWYDKIKNSVSISKKAKKQSDKIDECVIRYLNQYINLLESGNQVDTILKNEKNREYVDGLLENGGPSTDQFIKAIGKEQTEKLFHEVLFDTKK